MKQTIAPTLLRRLEDHFRTDLSFVEIHTDAAANNLNVDAGTYAFTIGSEIFFRGGTYDPESVFGQFLVGHEVTHVLQKRLHRERKLDKETVEAPPSWKLEMEADRSAIALIRGVQGPELSSDSSKNVRAFGPVGHYFTVYYLALAAGFSNDQASDFAFYAQLPDEITELDAVEVVMSWLTTYLMRLSLPGDGPLSVVKWLTTEYGTGDVLDYMIWPEDFVAIIQRGLHCLTGGSSAAETAYRSGRLEAANLAKPEYVGLALHAYADSFAHRMIGHEDRLYGYFAGHAIVPFTDQRAKIQEMTRKNLGFFELMHSVDNIAYRPTIYRDYVHGLFDLLKGKNGGKSLLGIDKVDTDMAAFVGTYNEKEQEGKIRERIIELAEKQVKFFQSGATVSWLTSSSKFVDGKHKPSFQDVLYHAASWSRWTPGLDQVMLKFANTELPNPKVYLTRKCEAALASLYFQLNYKDELTGVQYRIW